jgi:hypothetical protein
MDAISSMFQLRGLRARTLVVVTAVILDCFNAQVVR